MKQLLGHAIPGAKIFQLATSFPEFETWLKDEHNKEIDANFFLGFRFFLECAFSSIVDSIASDDDIGIKGDLLLLMATSEYKFIKTLTNSCEKTILLKNIYDCYTPISEAENFDLLKTKVPHFLKNVIEPVIKIYDSCYKIKSKFKISPLEANNFLIMEFLYFYYHQINNKPYAFEGALLKEPWIPIEKMQGYLEGYKYTVQFVWYKILGQEKFSKTSLKNIHTADNWNTYIYDKPYNDSPQDIDELIDILNRTFDLEKQTSFDSYFYRIKDELIVPLEKKYPFFIHTSDTLFEVTNNSFPKKVFKKLITRRASSPLKISKDYEFDMMFYWFPLSVIDTGTPYHFDGLATFLTLLAGTGALFKKSKIFDKILVYRFLHPTGDTERKRNDLSYAILIDSSNSAGYVSCGWMVFYDCSRDDRGFPGNKTKEISNKLINRKILKVTNKKVDKEEFKNYLINHFPHQFPQDSFAFNNETKILKIFDSNTNANTNEPFIRQAKAIILELASYYVVTKHRNYNQKYSNIDWSISSELGEIDIMLSNETEALLIECKLNADNGSKDEVISNAKKKLKSQFPKLKHTIEVWAWKASTQTIAAYSNHNISCYSLSDGRERYNFRSYFKGRVPQILNS